MTRIGIWELRRRASRYVALVKKGETIEVTERGRLAALLVPPDDRRTTREGLIEAGLLVPAVNPTGRLRSPHPVPVEPDAASRQELLDANREERLPT